MSKFATSAQRFTGSWETRESSSGVADWSRASNWDHAVTGNMPRESAVTFALRDLFKDDQDAPAKNLMDLGTSSAQEVVTKELRPPANFRAPNFGRRGMKPIASWEGVVEEVSADSFKARLTEVVNGAAINGGFEVSEFLFEDLAIESDVKLVAPGAVFYWTLGRAKNEAGTVANSSMIRFRRLPLPSKLAAIRVDAEAKLLLEELQNESP